MTHGAVKLKIVADRLDLVRDCLEGLRALPSASFEEFLADRRNVPAAESHLRRAIESLFDVARHLLAKGFGIVQLEYRGVARAAAEKGLITDDALAEQLRKIAGFRNRLVHHYDEVTPEELYAIVHGHLGDLEKLAAELEVSGARLAGEPRPA